MRNLSPNETKVFDLMAQNLPVAPLIKMSARSLIAYLVHICLDLSPCGSDAIPQHGGYHHVLAGGVAAQRTHVVFFKLLRDVQPKVVNVGDVGPYWHVVAQVTTPLIVRENQQVILTPCRVPVEIRPSSPEHIN